MSLQKFQYSLLKYCPSQLLGEQVNVGILFFFEGDNELKFIYPKALSRLSSLFGHINLNVFKDYFKALKKKVFLLSKDKAILRELTINDIIKNELFVPDSNSLFFGKVETAKYKDFRATLEHYHNQYFAPYFGTPDSEKHSDKYLLKTFSDKIVKKDSRFKSLAKRDYKVSNKRGIYTKFEYAWQNGSLNLIKPLSFDLVHKSSIQEKSVKWFGYVSQLEETARQKNLLFNFLVAKPRNKKLFNSFDDAISILEDKKGLVKMVYEENFDDYVEEVEKTIKPLEEK